MPRLTHLSRSSAIAVMGAVYVVATLAAWLAVVASPAGTSEGVALGAASLAGTTAVFACSVLLDNSSAFDAYWSVAPMVTVPWLVARHGELGPRALLVTALVEIWGARLTWNWIRQWRGMDHEDFRYVDQRKKAGRAYWVVSFLGIHLFPAVLVYLGSLALLPALSSSRPLGALDALGALVGFGGTLVEATADRQLREFVTSPHDPAEICTRGLWAWSRHPNYLGEMMLWWGLAFFALGAAPGELRWAGGALAITLLFNVVSIPLMERRMLRRRPQFRDHQRRVSRILPLPPKRAA